MYDRDALRLKRLIEKGIGGLRYSEHVASDGRLFRAQACKLGLEGAIVPACSKEQLPP